MTQEFKPKTQVTMVTWVWGLKSPLVCPENSFFRTFVQIDAIQIDLSSTIQFGVGDRRPTADPLTKSPYTKMVSNLTKSE